MSGVTSKSLIKFCKTFYVIFLIISLGLFFYFKSTVWAGFGLASSVLSIVSFLHFSNKNKSFEKPTSTIETIETPLTWVLLLSSFLGFGVIMVNHYQSNSSFIFGLGAGLCLNGAVSYVLELLDNFLSSIR